jgi:hypothetical protein
MAIAADEAVVAVAALEPVVALASGQDVVAVPAIQAVPAVTAEKGVRRKVAEQVVVAAEPEEPVVGAQTIEGVGLVRARVDVRTVRSKPVLACHVTLSIDSIIAAGAKRSIASCRAVPMNRCGPHPGAAYPRTFLDESIRGNLKFCHQVFARRLKSKIILIFYKETGVVN